MLLKVCRSENYPLSFLFRIADQHGNTQKDLVYAPAPDMNQLPSQRRGEKWYRVEAPPGTRALIIPPLEYLQQVYVDGKPQLRVQRGKGVYKLSPQARSERLDKAIPTIPVDAIQQFLTQPLVVDEDTLEDAAYVVSSADEHLIVGAGDRAYVRGIDASQGSRYQVFRPGDAYVDPDSGEILGYEALSLGDGDAHHR